MEKIINREAAALSEPVSDNGGMHEIYDNSKEARELDYDASALKRNSGSNGTMTTTVTAVELDIAPAYSNQPHL
ncbi:hypothetical protein OCU04_000879 [Sclerotinia nivalis]|uniref:Uncharacterized protein n=1 Tax=Sclerotinia nivalis TaxID=352851 RepID=A0A9X0AX08_9HELO|nr:hypothetical protein OCU04_000879 [Sclerotinia nivalis]